MSGLRITARVLASLLGAYAVTSGFAALLAVLMILSTRVSRTDALIAASMISYVVFAVVMMWCFAERKLGRVWLVLLGAAIATHALAIWLEPMLPVIGNAP